ncbi:hypothetical protein GCM10010319_13310 [Streptomyces blastmyceticus]|uniref:Uncharacterized protein n=1 Tax=Streptomyces blastmyceticus TaxID=68180 RepID=A0ABN0WIN1_9ACTN
MGLRSTLEPPPQLPRGTDQKVLDALPYGWLRLPATPHGRLPSDRLPKSRSATILRFGPGPEGRGPETIHEGRRTAVREVTLLPNSPC